MVSCRLCCRKTSVFAEKFRVQRIILTEHRKCSIRSKPTSKQTEAGQFSFWHWAGPYASRDDNLKIACHTAHIVTLGHGGGGKYCLTLNDSDTSHLSQPVFKATRSTFQLLIFLKKKKKSNPSGVPRSWVGAGTSLPTLQRRWLRYWKIKLLRITGWLRD